VEALDKYLASLPLEKAEGMGVAEHQAALADLGKKIAAVGGSPVESLQLFACAHMEAILLGNQRPDADAVRLARLQAAKGTDIWGPPETLARVLLAQQLMKPKSLLDLRRALDAAAGSQDAGTRMLAALAAFTGEEFDPKATCESFRKVATQAKDTPVGSFCDQVAKQLKDAHWCADCKGEGRYLCKTCNAVGMAPCETCNGTGNVIFGGGMGGGRFGDRGGGGGLTPCKVCRQKGKVICPTCGGGRYAKCATCNGAKVRKTIPVGDYKGLLETSLCKSCGGTGGVFARTLYPCPSCDGLGRFPKQ